MSPLPLSQTYAEAPHISQLALADQSIEQMQAHDWQGASKTYAEIVRSNPYSASHWFNYGYALHKSQRYKEAIRAWKKAIALGFGFDTKLWRKYVYLEEWWRSFGPKINAPWYMIARAQAQSGRNEEALKSLARALEGGFADEPSLAKEPDLAPLRDDPQFQGRFRALVGTPPEGLSREAQWHFDLDFMARRLEQIHYDIYRAVSRRRFRGTIEKLKARLSTLEDYQIIMEIRRIVAMIRDGHTVLYWPRSGPYALFNYPLECWLYSDGLYVQRAATSLAEIVGGRVLRIGNHRAETVLKAVEPLCSVDNTMGLKIHTAFMVGSPYALAALKLIEAADMDHLPLEVQKPDGTRITVELSRHTPFDGTWVWINAGATNPVPLSLDVHDTLWFQFLPKHNLVYCQCNGIAHEKEENFSAFFRRLTTFLTANNVDYLAIDLRYNSGGDSGLNQALLHALIRCDRINRRGHLFVLIGRMTFSAAQNLTSSLERETAAVFVGEPSGSRANFVGQSTEFTLPCSQLTLSCSSLYHQDAGISCDFRTWIEPDIVAETSSQDAANNRDPGMEAILKEIASTDPPHA